MLRDLGARINPAHDPTCATHVHHVPNESRIAYMYVNAGVVRAARTVHTVDLGSRISSSSTGTQRQRRRCLLFSLLHFVRVSLSRRQRGVTHETHIVPHSTVLRRFARARGWIAAMPGAEKPAAEETVGRARSSSHSFFARASSRRILLKLVDRHSCGDAQCARDGTLLAATRQPGTSLHNILPSGDHV